VRVVKGDGDDRAADRLGPDDRGKSVRLVAEALDLRVAGRGVRRELVDLGLQLADLFGLGGYVAVLVDDEGGQVTAGGAQLGAVGGGVARRKENPGQRRDDGDDDRPGGWARAALRHTFLPRLA
jgi:hypothetical protein